MRLFYNPFSSHLYGYFLLSILIFFFDGSLHAVRWPLAKVPNTQKNIFDVSKKKYIIRSSTSVKKAAIKERMEIVFSSSLSSLPFYEDQVLQNLFLDARKQSSIKVRVLLAKAENDTTAEWKFLSSTGFIVHIEDASGVIRKSMKVSKLFIKIKHGSFYINDKQIKHTIRLRPIDGCGEYNGVMYDGDFIITSYQNTFLCINQVKLEDYVCAVLRTESWPGWPLEVNKVFAIACRSYVMFKMLEAQRNNRPYHVKNTNAHQTYRGKHDLPLLKTAVKETHGVVLGFKGAPILAMFDCCCGGIIPAFIEDFDFNKVPYLARTYACNYCKQSSLYSWQISYAHTAFELIVKQYLGDMVQLSDIQIIKKDKSGLVTQIKLKGPKYTHIISGKKLYSMIKEIKSFHFDIQKKSNVIIVKGQGFGHHLGLCQWGARQMVREGWDYKSILRFYYPGSYFMHLI